MDNLLHISSTDILTNARKKYILVNGEKILLEILAFDCKKFNPTKAELSEPITKNRNGEESSAKKNWDRSIRRAKKSIYDYMLSNFDLDSFVTLTFDKEKIDRYDYKAIIKKLNQWLDNLVRRKNLKYVLVPEYHKDGAVHFHGFMNSEALTLNDSGKKSNNKIVYNINNFAFGFSTLVKIGSAFDERLKVSGYIGKYITKSIEGTIGGRYYIHGGDLKKPIYEYLDLSFQEFEGDMFSPYPNSSAKIWRYNFKKE